MSAESKSENSDRLKTSTSDVSPSSTMTPTTTTTTTPAATASTSQTAPAATKPTSAGQQDEQHHQKTNKTSYLVNKQQIAATALHQHYLNYFNSNLSKEEAKSQRTRGSIFNSLSQHSQQQAILSNQEFQHPNASQSIAHQRFSNHQQHMQNPRVIHQNPGQIVYIPPTSIPPSQSQQHYASPTLFSNNNLSRSFSKDEAMMQYKLQLQQQLQHQQHHHHQQQHQQQQPQNQRSYPSSANPSHHHHQSHLQQRQSKDSSSKMSAHNIRQDQLDKDSEKTTTIMEELENDLEGYKNSELEAISSLERNLPIELSFLIRQQAHCMAKMNYLDRQIRELKEAANYQQQVDMNQVSSSSISNRNHSSRPINNKNGNFILSDDSGGEYSRATVSDDDELSSLLDQIAKTVRPEQRSVNDNMLFNCDNQIQHFQQQQQYQQQRISSAYNTLISNQQQFPQPPYTIINPNQLHHQQAVPIFVMGSPIAVAHPSSISSNILPGVHFQSEPRYQVYFANANETKPVVRQDDYGQQSADNTGQADINHVGSNEVTRSH
jgi:hypothetical protein